LFEGFSGLSLKQVIFNKCLFVYGLYVFVYLNIVCRLLCSGEQAPWGSFTTILRGKIACDLLIAQYSLVGIFREGFYGNYTRLQFVKQ
jgi:hypothetical protein